MSTEIENERATKVPFETFWKGYMEGVKNGETASVVADRLGMKLPSFISRASQERKKLRKDGVNVPILQGSNNGISREEKKKQRVDFVQGLLEGLDDDTKDSDE